MGQKVIIRIWWESGSSSSSRNHLTTFCRHFVNYACDDCVPRQLTSSETLVFVLSAMAEQRKCWPHWLHYQFL